MTSVNNCGYLKMPFITEMIGVDSVNISQCNHLTVRLGAQAFEWGPRPPASSTAHVGIGRSAYIQ